LGDMGIINQHGGCKMKMIESLRHLTDIARALNCMHLSVLFDAEDKPTGLLLMRDLDDMDLAVDLILEGDSTLSVDTFELNEEESH